MNKSYLTYIKTTGIHYGFYTYIIFKVFFIKGSTKANMCLKSKLTNVSPMHYIQYIYMYQQAGNSVYSVTYSAINTVCPRSLDQFYIGQDFLEMQYIFNLQY